MLSWMQDEYVLTSADRVVHKTPIGFDVSVWEIFWTLTGGATLVVARPDGHRDPAYLARLVRDEQVTIIHFVPSMLGPFLDAPGAEGCGSLRLVVCSGEELPGPLAGRFAATLPATRLDNLYGPTEAAVDVTSFRVDGATPGAGGVPIGRPVWNTRVHVLDAALRPVPPGITGELYLAGVQLADGYAERRGLTAERFVADPYGAPGERMYRTGDLARWTGTGVVEFLGRVDGQVKLRGLRIEPGEIEAALAALPGVGRAVVVLRDDPPAPRRLVAYLVGRDLDGDGVRAGLAATLPEHLVPAAFVVLDELPVTANGKLARDRLPAPGLAAGAVAPRTDAERTLAAIVADLLGLERVGVEDDVFRLGADSIVAMQLVSRARRAGLALSTRQVFRRRTVAALGALAEPAREAVTAAPSSLVALTGDERDELAAAGVAYTEVLPLTPLQQGLLFHASLDVGVGGGETSNGGDGVDLYTVQMTFELGETDPARLAAAGQAVLDRHANLRAGYRFLRSGRAVAVVEDGVRLPWTVTDISGLPETERDAAWRDVLEREGRRFDPATPPLLRMALVTVAPGRRRLVVTHQHLVMDGWSRGPLLRELAAAYAGEALPAGAHYRDYLAWLRRSDRSAR
jgi:aryl carrier-like protein